MLIYSLFMMVILLAIVSLALDYGRVQMIKTELQRTADATARGALQMYASDGSTTASIVTPMMASQSYNPVDANSGISPTASITWGYWNASTKTFTAGSGSPMAVQVTMSRTAANGNAVPLTFPLMNGLSALTTTCNVSATAIAVMQSRSTTTTTVSGTSDLWLSGMPAGSTAGWSDTTTNAPSTLALNVTPGQVLTFSATGMTSNKGPTGNIGAAGSGSNTTHMSGSPDGNYNGLQNGIQTLTAPQNGLIGVFLTNAAPNTVTPPSSALSYNTAASMNQSTYSSLLVQQPFYIGSGQTSSGTTQSFVVPAGATRFYLGVFDGWQNWDNPGALTVTSTVQPQVYLVK
jgi:hypothetical protein